MKRKTSSTPSRVYTYGVYDCITNKDKAFEQLRLANIYYNKLIEIERERRTKFREVRLTIGEELGRAEKSREDLTERIEALRAEIKGKRKEARARVEDAERTAVIRSLSVERRAAHDRVKKERQRLATDPTLIVHGDRINEEAYAKMKQARAECGLYWGTYLLVERAAEQAKKSKVDPRFKRYEGTGRIGVQIQKGMTKAELSGPNTLARLGALQADTWDTRRGRRYARASLDLRIGSEGTKPVFAGFKDVTVHRPLPDDSKIMWAWIKMSKIGPRRKYELQLTLESETFQKKLPPKGTERSAGIDLGWRQLPSGDIRVAYIYDAFGKTRELRLPAAIPMAITKAASIISINDGHFNTARLVLKGWMAEHPELVPEWLVEETKTMHAWHQRGRLARVAHRIAAESKDYLAETWKRWRTSRLAQKLDLFDTFDEVWKFVDAPGGPASLLAIMVYLDFWRRKEMHLWQMEANMRSRAMGRRKDLYRNWAARLEKEYAIVVLERFDLRKIAKAAEPEEADQGSARRRHRGAVAPNEFRLALLSALGHERVKTVPAEFTTRDHDCGHRNVSEAFTLDKEAEIMVRCDQCNVEFDQDAQAAKNILNRYLGRKDDGSSTKALSLPPRKPKAPKSRKALNPAHVG